MNEFAKNLATFWWSPIGVAIVAWSFAYPASCEPPTFPLMMKCKNFWGIAPFTAEKAPAVFGAVAFGLFCWIAVIGLAQMFKDRS